MSNDVVLKCPKCEAPVPSDPEADAARRCGACGVVYRVVDQGFATRMIADPNADRGDVGRRLFVLAFLVLLALVFGALALYFRLSEPG
jgi:hypothetical protein